MRPVFDFVTPRPFTGGDQGNGEHRTERDAGFLAEPALLDCLLTKKKPPSASAMPPSQTDHWVPKRSSHPILGFDGESGGSGTSTAASSGVSGLSLGPRAPALRFRARQQPQLRAQKGSPPGRRQAQRSWFRGPKSAIPAPCRRSRDLMARTRATMATTGMARTRRISNCHSSIRGPSEPSAPGI